MQPEENKLIAEIESTYKKYEDSLYGAVRKKLKSKYYKGISPYVHTVTEKTEQRPSFLVFRLIKRQEQKDSIDNHIKFISKLTHFSNQNTSIALRYITVPDPSPIGKRIEIALIGKVNHPDSEQSRMLAHNFSHDIFNLLSITMQNAYEFEPVSFTEERLFFSYFRPFNFNHIVEVTRKLRSSTNGFDVMPFQGNSTMITICEMMLRQKTSTIFSVNLHPIQLTEPEIAYFEKSISDIKKLPLSMDASMFLLGSEPNPSRYLSNVTTIHKMMSEGSHAELPSCILKIYVASEEPISGLLINTVGNELAGGNEYEYHEPDSDQENEVAINNLTFLEHEEFRVSDDTDLSLGRKKFLFNPYDASRAFRLPLGIVSGAIPTLFSVIPAPVAVLPQDGVMIGEGFHPAANRRIPIKIRREDRRKHVYIIGKTGTGKSTLMSSMIQNDIKNNEGVCVIDPHGDLIEFILPRIPAERVDDVILLDPSDYQRPVGLNMLEHDPHYPHHKDFVVQEMIAILYKLFLQEHVGPMFEHNVRNAMLTVMDDPQKMGTLLEVPLVFTDKEFADIMSKKVQDPAVKEYWKHMSKTSDFHKSEMLGYIISKFDRFTANRMMRYIIGQEKSAFNFREIMDGGKILLVNLSKGALGEINSSLLGMIIISKLQWAAMSRVNMHEIDRRDFYLYVDEFQNFASSGFDVILSEARKYKLNLIIANQHVGQLMDKYYSKKLIDAIFGNVGTFIAFRVGVTDADILAREFGYPVTPQDLENLENYATCVKLLIKGEVQTPFTMWNILSDEVGDQKISEGIREISRLKYGRDVQIVEGSIEQRIRDFKSQSTPVKENDSKVSL